MFNSRFLEALVKDEAVYKSELSMTGNTFGVVQPLLLSKGIEQVVNTVIETTLIPANIEGSVTIPADTLEEGDVIETIMTGAFVKNLGGIRDYTLSVKLGGYFGSNINFPFSALTGIAGYPFKLVHQFKMINNGGSIEPRPYNTQLIAGTTGTNIVIEQQPVIIVNPIGWSNAVDNDIDITVQNSIADPQMSLASNSIICNLIKFR